MAPEFQTPAVGFTPAGGASLGTSNPINNGSGKPSGEHKSTAHQRVLSHKIQTALNGSAKPQAQPQLAYVGHTDGADKGGSKPSLGFMA